MNLLRPRIEFIDLAKGFTILLVVLYHVDPKLQLCQIGTMFRMPLYFFLSGLFFSATNKWLFLLKKVNRLLIPFFFFWGVMFPIYYLTFGNFPEFFYNEKIFANRPIWFLLCLFEVNVISYFIFCLTKGKIKWTFFVFSLCGVMGFLLNRYKINLPLYIDTALTCCPFFFVGYFLRKKTNLLNDIIAEKILNKILLLLFVVLLLCFFKPIELRLNIIPNDIFTFYMGAFSGIFFVFFLSKKIGYIPYLSYIGRYSIVILCIHYFVLEFYMIYIEPKIILSDVIVATMIKFFFVIVVSSLFIPLFKRFIPWFIAQKDLIPIKK